jgi:hypothetical protein
LEVTVHAQVVISRHKHLRVDRAMGIMADGASIAHGLVFEDERTPLRGMTPEAVLVFPEQGGATFDGRAFVGIMAVMAIHPLLGHLMMLRQREFPPDIQMAFETVLRGWAWMHNRLPLRSSNHPQWAGLIVDGWWCVPAGLGVPTYSAPETCGKTTTVSSTV